MSSPAGSSDTPNFLFITRGWRGRGLSFLLGALAVLGLAPFHIWPLTLICLALLFARLKWAVTSDTAGKTAFWFALGYFLIGTSWIGSAFIARGSEFILVMPPMILALAALLASFWGLAGWLYARINPQGHWAGLTFVSLFFLAEFVRGHLFGGFPWNLPGYIFEAGGAVSQSASIFGIYGLSLIVFILAALLSSVLFSPRRIAPAIAILIILGASFGYGAFRLDKAAVGVVDNVRLRIVQVRFNQKDKFDPEKSINIVNQFLTETVRPGIEDVTHVIWPEGAVNGLALENGALINAMGYALADIDDTPPIWLLNSLRLEERPNPRNGTLIKDYYNSSVAIRFSPEGIPVLAGLNDKRRLVPFGEFVPGGKWMEARGVPVISTALASISAAPEKTNIDFPGLPKLSPQICYEIIFSGLTPHPETGPRAEWILNQSNDAWYGASLGPLQHSNMASYRAIEEGLPVVRAAANGISGVINPYGNYSVKITPKTTGIADFQLPQPLQNTLFSSGINVLLGLLNLFAALLCIALGRSGKS